MERLATSSDQKWYLLRAVVTAVAQHHSASAGLGEIDHSRASSPIGLEPTGIQEFCRQTGLPTLDRERIPKTADDWEILANQFLIRNFEDSDDWKWRALETIVHRITRLADQRGTSLGASRRT